MQIREINAPFQKLCLRALMWSLMGMVVPPVTLGQEGDERTPLIVSDDGSVAGGTVVPVDATSTSTTALAANPEPGQPATQPTAPGNGPSAVGEEVRRAVVGSSSLLDPTEPTEQIERARTPGSEPIGNPLLPRSSGVGAVKPPLTSGGSEKPKPDKVEEVERIKPVTATTPFATEPKRNAGPVVMGTDLEPADAETALSPDQTPPEFLDAPVVESADPWVFGVEVATLYDDNIRLSNAGKQSDFIFLLQAGVAWQSGDVKRKKNSWRRAVYEATAVAFAEAGDQNNVDHRLELGGQKRWGSLALAMEGRYRRLSGATPDLGDRVQRDDYFVKVGGSYEFSGKTFAEASASYSGVRYDLPILADYDEWVAEGFAGYELSGRTRIAAGGAVGQTRVSSNGTQEFQRVLAKVSRVSTGALSLNAKAGAEFRQTPRGNKTTPVFAVGADWEPVADGTKISVQAFRETVASGALAGENYLRTGGSLRVAQQLGSRFSAGLEAGYEQLAYSAAATSSLVSGRADDYFFAKPSLKYEFAARRRAEVFYNFREDDSSVDEFSFTANQWGLSFGLDF
jgi:hypothetical protein